MTFTKTIKNLTVKFPKLSRIAFNGIKKYWNVKSHLLDYEYPLAENKADISLKEVKEYNKERIFGPKKRICYAPFNNIHFTTDGKVSACSFNFDYFIGDINEQSIHDIWFGEKAEIFRNTLSNYNLQKCISCKNVLESGNYSAFPANKYDLFSDDTTELPTQMSFEISNLCNLECVMCNGNFSSLIRKNRENLPPLKYSYPENFVEQLTEFIPHLKIATFVGGEPLLIKIYYEIWEKIIKLNPNCSIHIQTNATVLNERFLKLLDSGQFEIGISIDAITKETYEEIRVNAKYEEVFSNLDKLISYQKKEKIYINLNFCPLTINWKELPHMIRYANSKNIILKILNVDSPFHLCIKQQSSDYIMKIHDELFKEIFTQNSNINIKRNTDSYHAFLNGLKHQVILAKDREQFIEQESNHDIEAVIKRYEKEIYCNLLFRHFSDEEKKTFINGSLNKMFSSTTNESLLKILIARHVQNFIKVNSEANAMRGLHDTLNMFSKLNDGFYKLISSGIKPCKAGNISYKEQPVKMH